MVLSPLFFTIFSSFRKILTFTIEHWRVFAVILMLCLIWHYKSSYDTIASELAQYRKNEATLIVAGKQMQESFEKISQQHQLDLVNARDSALAEKNIDHKKLTTKMKGEINGLQKLLAELDVASGRGLHVSADKTASGVPAEGRAEGFSEARGYSDETSTQHLAACHDQLKLVIQAAQDTDIQYEGVYNSCKSELHLCQEFSDNLEKLYENLAR